METFARFENTPLSIWFRESGVAFFSTLTLHSLAMGLVVGINIALGLRLAGFARSIPLQGLRHFYPLHWFCALLILLSGIGLLIAYPAKALTNPVFYLKLCALSVALLLSRYFQNWMASQDDEINPTPHLRRLAIIMLVLWIITITAGRFLAYTHWVLLASHLS